MDDVVLSKFNQQKYPLYCRYQLRKIVQVSDMKGKRDRRIQFLSTYQAHVLAVEWAQLLGQVECVDRVLHQVRVQVDQAVVARAHEVETLPRDAADHAHAWG